MKSLFPEDVSDQEWSHFVNTLSTSTLANVSPTNDLGMFDFKVRRLADLDAITNLRRIKHGTRWVWSGTFKKPLTSDAFLKSLHLQYQFFCLSMKEYYKTLDRSKLLNGMPLLGALTILHRAGPQGLDSWNCGKRFTFTETLYNRVINGHI